MCAGGVQGKRGCSAQPVSRCGGLLKSSGTCIPPPSHHSPPHPCLIPSTRSRLLPSQKQNTLIRSLACSPTRTARAHNAHTRHPLWQEVGAGRLGQLITQEGKGLWTAAALLPRAVQQLPGLPRSPCLLPTPRSACSGNSCGNDVGRCLLELRKAGFGIGHAQRCECKTIGWLGATRPRKEECLFNGCTVTVGRTQLDQLSLL